MEQPNILAVLVAALLPMVIGSIWYGPLFGKKWMDLMGFTEESIKESFNATRSYGGSLIGAALMAYVIGLLIEATGMPGLAVALLCWAGFVVPCGWHAVAFEDKNMMVYVLSMAYNLVTLILMGILLSVW